ncbi:hypothetical protein F3Y22_tig00111191pilonHSYRG00237 [Hibiscus syriacus]|uniref:RNase H type-1 domain-containing protein n=1 Tax=Hibiscus syriacus TaxID=106335 RepID=A0A6A2YWT9_HIBSY|nr:hypothetical protein F3Y22_tig00111191pilonHSYRG00237 [Hibiscus syriacus]
MNLNSDYFCIDLGVPWSILFSSIVWQAWKQRNAFIFKSHTSAQDCLLHQSISWAKHYYASRTCGDATLSAPDKSVQWNPPLLHWICLNCDGAVSQVSKFGAAGGIFRNHTSEFLLAFNKQLGIFSVTHAELWSIHEGLILAWVNGFKSNIIQIDNADVHFATVIYDPFLSSTIYRCFYAKAWFIDFVLIRREANMAADFVAKLTYPHESSLAIFDSPLPFKINLGIFNN